MTHAVPSAPGPSQPATLQYPILTLADAQSTTGRDGLANHRDSTTAGEAANDPEEGPNDDYDAQPGSTAGPAVAVPLSDSRPKGHARAEGGGNGNGNCNGNGIDQEWPLKSIAWPPFVDHPREVQILCQSVNGPCSLIALINILSLRGDIHIPLHQHTASFSFLSNLVADLLLRRSASKDPSTDLDFALSVLPKTLQGLDVNVDFISGAFSRPEGAQPGELELFQLAGIPMRHGWLCSRDERETHNVLTGTARSYDEAVMRIVQGDELTDGAITTSAHGGDTTKLEQILVDLSTDPDKQAKVYQAQVIRRWLDSSTTQLTYAGLFELSETLEPGSLCALFRNAHFSVLYRRPDALSGLPDDIATTGRQSDSRYMPRATLFHLVTDASLLHEPGHVWESLEDVEGANSQFFDSSLHPAQSYHDYARQHTTGKRDMEEERVDADLALAAQMQQDEYDQEEMHARWEQRERKQELEQQRQEEFKREQQKTQAGRIAENRNAMLPTSGTPIGGIADQQQPGLASHTSTPVRTGGNRPKDKTDKATGKDKKEKGCLIS